MTSCNILESWEKEKREEEREERNGENFIPIDWSINGIQLIPLFFRPSDYPDLVYVKNVLQFISKIFLIILFHEF